MDQYFLLEKLYIYKLKYLIRQMLDKEITCTHKCKNIPSLLEDYQNCKPFLKNSHTNLIINQTNEQTSINVFNKKQDLNYLFYIIKGYTMTLEKYNTHQYFGEYLLVNKIINKIHIVIKHYNKLLNKQLKCIRLKYIDIFTNKVLCPDLVNTIYRLVY